MEQCKRMLVGAIGIKDNNIASFGKNYNEGNCTGEVGNCGCIHAEVDLLNKMVNPEIVIVSHAPCLECAKRLVQAGVKAVYFAIPYRKTGGLDYLIANDINVFLLSVSQARQL